jgi:TonB-dependent SusC/RagA subfamily outer membrane receptor
MKDASTAIFGSRGAGGAILITTKTGDGNFKMPRKPNVTSIRPLGYQIPAEFYSPKYSPAQGSVPAGRDNRKTLYWNPCVKLSNAGEGQFEFYTADKHTSYTVIMQGVTYDGKIIFRKERINKN